MSLNQKIRPIEELAGIVTQLRAERRRIVYCHGVFDLIHVGVVRHFEQARRQGDLLVVTIASDQHAARGPVAARFNEDLRAEAIAALSQVDYVAVNRWPHAVEAIQLLRPDVYAPWDEAPETDQEFATARAAEEAALRAVGGRLLVLERIAADRPSPVHHWPDLPTETGVFLGSFSSRNAPEVLWRCLENVRPLRVLLVGETIIDEYQYCETIGKSGKEPVLAVRYVSTEKFAGGVLAAANQAAAFCDHVGMLTLLGADDSHEQFIREKLNPAIDATFLSMPGSPTILKRRVVELYPFQKLLEVYVMDPEVADDVAAAVYARLEAVLPSYDLVVVTDYGHGMLTPEVIELLCSQSAFLAVNTQTNAANQGYNTISKYARADYVCLSERETRLEVRNRQRDLRLIVPEVAERLSCQRMLITQGQQGCLCYQKSEGFFKIPPFTRRIVDRVGAGDALFAVTAMCAVQGAPMEVVGVIGNAVGSQAVEIVGNREVVTRRALLQQIDSLFGPRLQTN